MAKTKTPKTVASESNKKARYQTEGYKRSEERKKLRRARDAYQKKLESGKIKDTQAARDYLAQQNKLINESYMQRSGEKRGTYSTSLKQFQSARISVQETVRESRLFFDTTQNYDVDIKTRAQKRRESDMFQRQINQASISGGVSALNKYEVKTLYAATQRYWEGTPSHLINQKLMQVFDVSSIKDVYDIVMSNEDVQRMLEQARKNGEIIESTEDDSFKKDGTDESSRKGSPDSIQQLISILGQQENPFNINLAFTEDNYQTVV